MLHPKQENKMNSEHSRRTVDCCLFRLPGQRSHVAACAELRAHCEPCDRGLRRPRGSWGRVNSIMASD